MSILGSLFGNSQTAAEMLARQDYARQQIDALTEKYQGQMNAMQTGTAVINPAGWGTFLGGGGGAGGSGNVQGSVYQNTPQTYPTKSRAEEMAERIAAVNRQPATVVSLRQGYDLFAARWGMGWVDVGERPLFGTDEMNWCTLAERLVNAGMAETLHQLHRLIERDNGNN